MSATEFFLSVIAALGVLAVPPLVYAKRIGILSFGEFLLPVAPPVLLLLSLQGFNKAAHTGLGFVVYPFACAAFSMALLYTRTFALGRINVAPIRVSIWILIAACAVAFCFGAVAKPLYE